MTTERMAFGTIGPTQPPGEQFQPAVARIEDDDWDSMWWPDHFMGLYPQSIWSVDHIGDLAVRQPSPHTFFETMTSLGYAGAETDNIRLGTHVTEPLRRHPITIAQASSTVHHLTGGRMILGLGAGEKENVEPYGLPYDRQVSRLEEALDIIELAWNTPVGTRFNYDGTFWQLRDAVFDLPPLEADGASPWPELWIGAHGPRMLSLTGKHGDGWLPTGLSPTEYAESWERIAESARDAGRNPDQITRALSQSVVLATTREECETLLNSLLLRLDCLALPADRYQIHGYQHPLGEEFDGILEYVPSRLDREAALAAAERVPLEVMKDHYLWGSPEDLTEQVEAYAEAGVTHLVLLNQTYLANLDMIGQSFDLLADVRANFA